MNQQQTFRSKLDRPGYPHRKPHITSAILTESMKYRKNTSTKRITTKTPKTDDLVNKVQSVNLPFSHAFYQLLELTRAMEREVSKLKISIKNLKDQQINLISE